MPVWLLIAGLGLLSLVVTAVATTLCKGLAHRLDVVARPKADRWHRQTIPLLGGVALVAGTIGTAVIAPIRQPEIWVLLAGASLLALVGFVDDLRPLKPQSKFVAQLLVASAAIALGLRFPLTGIASVDILVTLFWIVGITNAFNLLDNMDGLAAGIAAIAGLVKLTFFVWDGYTEGAYIAAIFVGAMIGFLVHNTNPASIFMGDTGSLFVGFIVGGLNLIGGPPNSRGTASVLIVPLLMSLVPIFDTAFVTVVRLLAGRPISQGGRDHTSHRLVASGLSERQAVWLLYGVAGLSGLIAVYTRRFGFGEGVVVLALFCLAVMLLGVYLGRVRVYPDAAAVPEGSRIVGLVADFSYKRQVATVIIDCGLVILAYYAAYRLRFEDAFQQASIQYAQSLPIVIACKMGAFAFLRVYQGVWRYTGTRDLLRLTYAIALGSILSVVAMLFLYRFEGYSRAVFVLDALLLLVFVAGSRVAFRVFAETLRPAARDTHNVVIYGAGDGGVMLLREIRNNSDLKRIPVGFLDDDPTKLQTKVQGLAVLGGFSRLESVLERHTIAEVIVSSAHITDGRLEELERLCSVHGVAVSRAVLRIESTEASPLDRGDQQA